MNKSDKIYVAGHQGLIGSAIMRRFIKDGYTNILTKTHAELDLTDQYKVGSFFEKERPDYVFFAAAKVGGVFANNTYRAEFIYENIMMQSNIIHCSFFNEVKKLIFFACADIYPTNCPQPAKEGYLLSGPLEPTCEPYALAKIVGLKMCESYNRQFGTNFIVLVPPNVYGSNEHYDIFDSQVIPALIKRFHETKVNDNEELRIWGTGLPVRDFLFVDDVVDACIFLMNEYSGNGAVNIGTGKGYSIRELSEIIKNEIGFKGRVVFDNTKLGGVLTKLLDTSKINSLGWRYKTELLDGIRMTYNSFLEQTEKKEIRISRIGRMQITEEDINFIGEAKSRVVLKNIQPDTYEKKVVIKPWGYEFLMFENEFIAIWLLHIKKGHSTSMHCHVQKKTSLIMLSGRAMINMFLKRRYLKPCDALMLEKSVFHSTKSLSEEGIFLLEIESPPNKTDLVRLEDRYGREQLGYEGIAEMETSNIEEYNFFSFRESDCYEKFMHTAKDFSVSLEIFLDNNDFQKHFKTREGELYTCCRGKILSKDGNTVLDIADTQKADALFNTEELFIPGKLALLETIAKVE
jgi:GDP-L-fucose synthase